MGMLSRREQSALRSLLIQATAASGRSVETAPLERLVRESPVEFLSAAAGLHRLAGSVLHGLDGVERVPDPVRAQLSLLQQQSSLRHLLITGSLLEIQRAFDNAGLS